MQNVLDHGYVKLIECWGTGIEGRPTGIEETDYECGIIEAARQSTQGSFRGWETDEKLLRYLLNHKHNSPFEFAGMVIEIQAPIFVFREWHRHRTQSYNEMSARYEPLPDLNYIPTIERIMLDAGKNKQAQSIDGIIVTETAAKQFRLYLEESYNQAQADYLHALSQGIPKELARCLLPVGRYSRMRASANLRNWLHFLTLRLDENAQWEIRQYAIATVEIIKQMFPHTHRILYGE